jgi:hypothetical protein
VVVVGMKTAVIDGAPVALAPVSYTTGTVSGDVTSCGQPIAHARVAAHSALGNVSTDTWTGAYTLRAPVGAYTVHGFHGFGHVPFASIPISISSEPATVHLAHDLGTVRGLIERNGAPATGMQIELVELAAGYSCETPEAQCNINVPGWCHCEVEGRRLFCDATGCRWEMGTIYYASTGSDGLYTIDVDPGSYRINVRTGPSGDPMDGGQSGGILVATMDVAVPACQLTVVGVSEVPVPAGASTVVLASGITLTFEDAEAGTASFVATSTPPPGDPPPFQSAGLFYDLFVPSFNGEVEICLPYDEELVPDESALQLLHLVEGSWEDITTSVDTTANIVCGKTGSFSWFAVGFQADGPPPPPALAIEAPETVEADASCVGAATLTASGGSSYEWFLGLSSLGTGATITAALPLGEHTLRVVSGGGSATATVRVIDVTAPVASVAAVPGVLWPPNGKLVAITPSATITDNCDAKPTLTLLGATSPTASPTDIVMSDGGLRLRAFRAGTETIGRTYSLEYAITDASGNRATATATVVVPHDQR